MMCCGGDRDTRYCPECGKQLKEPPALEEIRAYCQSRLLRAQKRLDWYTSSLEKCLPATKRGVEVQLSKASKDTKRFSRWIEAVNTAILLNTEIRPVADPE